MSGLLDIRGVGCDFGSVRAVDGISLSVRESQTVSAGQVLLEIDTTEYALQVRGAEAQVATAEATYHELISPGCRPRRGR